MMDERAFCFKLHGTLKSEKRMNSKVCRIDLCACRISLGQGTVKRNKLKMNERNLGTNCRVGSD